MSKFFFIENKILQKNLDIAFEHIADLLALSESDLYKEKNILASSLRKTIVIHTASITEALLLWKLKQKIKTKKIKLSDEWIYNDIKILYKLRDEDEKEIIAGSRKKKTKKIDKLDFDKIIKLSLNYKIINQKLSKETHKLRELRNRLHIGGLTEMEKEYTKYDLNFVFSVLKKVENNIAN